MSPEDRLKELGIEELPRAQISASDPFANFAEALKRPNVVRSNTAGPNQ